MSWFVAPMCMCVNVCVQVETRASKHSLFTHSCVEQQLQGVYACVHKWVRCGEFPPWAPGSDSDFRKQESLSECVTADESAINEALRRLSSAGQFSNSLNGCLQLYKRFSSKTLEIRGLEHLAFQLSIHSGSSSWICNGEKCAEFAFLSYCCWEGLFQTLPVIHVTVKQSLKQPLHFFHYLTTDRYEVHIRVDLLKRPPMTQLGLKGKSHGRKSQSVESGKSISEGSKVSTSVER